MKKLVLLILMLSVGKAYAQRSNDYNNNRQDNYSTTRVKNYDNKPTTDDAYNQIRIIDTAQEIRADILPFKSDPKVKNDRYYFWYLNKVIHSTQGGYNGTLLNGHYASFYPDKNLKEDGNFDRGLKDGVWKTWNRKGDLTEVVTWNQGIQQSENQQSLFKKIPFLNKKQDPPQDAKPADSN